MSSSPDLAAALDALLANAPRSPELARLVDRVVRSLRADAAATLAGAAELKQGPRARSREVGEAVAYQEAVGHELLHEAERWAGLAYALTEGPQRPVEDPDGFAFVMPSGWDDVTVNRFLAQLGFSGPGQAVGMDVGEMDVHEDDQVPECRPDQLEVSVKWHDEGDRLAGVVEVRNVGGTACRVTHKPGLDPLSAQGEPIGAVTEVTMEARFPDHVRLEPGRRARSRIGWSAWRGTPPSDQVVVNWRGGTKQVRVDGPSAPTRTDGAQNLTSSWFALVEEQ